MNEQQAVYILAVKQLFAGSLHFSFKPAPSSNVTTASAWSVSGQWLHEPDSLMQKMVCSGADKEPANGMAPAAGSGL
jgi:hypothetical protein